MSAQVFPASNIGLPKSLDYSLPPSASESCRAYSVSVAPDGITQVSAPTTTNMFVANQVVQPQFNSQTISFSIPSGQSNSVFLDPNNTTLSFTLTFAISTASSVTGGICKLLSSASSFIQSLTLYSNNTPLESVGEYALLQNFLLQNTINYAERYGGVSVCMGSDSNSTNGIDLPHASTGSFRYNFSIPLLSMIGVNSEKMFPVGSINNLNLSIQTPSQLPIIFYATATTTQPVYSTNYTLSEWSLNMRYIDIGEQASQMLMMSLPNNRILYKTSTYTASQITLPSGSAGAQQLLLQIRNTSVKSIYQQFGMSNVGATQGLVSPNGLFDAICIGTNSRQLQIGGNYFPNRPLNDVSRSSEAYIYLIQALGGSIPKALGSVVNREQYNSLGGTTLPTGANIETFLVLPATIVRNAPTGSDLGNQSVVQFPSSAFYGYDVEKLGGTMFSGVNTRNSPPFLNLNLVNALTATISANCWGYSDVILSFDLASKSVQAFI